VAGSPAGEARLGVRFSIVFGTTECSPLLTQTKLDDSAQDRAETLGSPLPQTEIQIADIATGGPVPVGQAGELCTRGYMVMRGYHDAPEATAAAAHVTATRHADNLSSERSVVRPHVKVPRCDNGRYTSVIR